MPHAPTGRALALAAVLAALPAAGQTMYKWVDEKGVTHFSHEPPPDAKTEKKATKVTPKVIPSGNPGAYDPNAWKTKDAEAKKQRVERGQQAQAEARDDAKRAELCERARNRLGTLRASLPLFKANPDGSRTYLEDKAREAEIERAKEVEAEACR
jgi:hypothetical protein